MTRRRDEVAFSFDEDDRAALRALLANHIGERPTCRVVEFVFPRTPSPDDVSLSMSFVRGEVDAAGRSRKARAS